MVVPLQRYRPDDDDAWRLPGCSERCRQYRVTFPGRRYPETLVSHDPFAHEAYGERVLANGANRLAGVTVASGPLVVDGATCTVTVDGVPLHLTPLELGIILHLAANLGQVCSKREVLRAVWGPEYDVARPGPWVQQRGGPSEIRLLRVHLARLRAKLGPARRLVETVTAIGYRLVAEEAVS